jgi:copper(I)-binding protein
MTTLLHRRNLLQAGLALSAALCTSRATACEFFAPTLRVTHPWTRATPASAAFAVLGMRFDDVAEDDQLLDVQTPVAEAVMYTPGGHAGALLLPVPGAGLPLDIPAGRETVLGNADLHVSGPHLRLLRLTQDLEIGRTYPLRLVFRKGGTLKAQLSVDHARFT